MKAKIICLLFGFGAGSRKEAKEAKIPPLPFSLPDNQRENANPVPVTLPGNGKVLNFKHNLISISFKSRGSSFLYDIYLRDIAQFMPTFPLGNRMLKFQMEQGMVNEEIYKSFRCTISAKKKLEFRTNFQDIVWPEQEFGRMYILEVYERFVRRPRVAKPRKKKETPPSA